MVNEIVEELEKFNPKVLQRLRSVSISSNTPLSARRQSVLSAASGKKGEKTQPNKRLLGKAPRQGMNQDVKHEKVQKGRVSQKIF